MEKVLGTHGRVRIPVRSGSVRRMLLAAAPVPLALALLVALFGIGPWSSPPTAHASGTTTDVLLVHGFDYDNNGVACDGGDVGVP